MHINIGFWGRLIHLERTESNRDPRTAPNRSDLLTVRSSISSDLFIDVEFGIAQLSKLSEFLSPGSELLFSIDDFEVSLGN